MNTNMYPPRAFQRQNQLSSSLLNKHFAFLTLCFFLYLLVEPSKANLANISPTEAVLVIPIEEKEPSTEDFESHKKMVKAILESGTHGNAPSMRLKEGDLASVSVASWGITPCAIKTKVVDPMGVTQCIVDTLVWPNRNGSKNNSDLAKTEKKTKVVFPLSFKVGSSGQWKVETQVSRKDQETYFSTLYLGVLGQNEESNNATERQPQSEDTLTSSGHQILGQTNEDITQDDVLKVIADLCQTAQTQEIIDSSLKQQVYETVSLAPQEDISSWIIGTLPNWPLPEDNAPFEKLMEVTAQHINSQNIEQLLALIGSEDSSEATKLWALGVLAKVRDFRHIEDLKSILETSEQWQTTQLELGTSPPMAAAYSLVQMGTKKSTQELINLVGIPTSEYSWGKNPSDFGQDLKFTAISDALDTINSAEAVSLLDQIANDTQRVYSFDQRLVALNALKTYWENKSKKKEKNE